jgi:DNA-directed RNA polymerase specialized sigma24 family protein
MTHSVRPDVFPATMSDWINDRLVHGPEGRRDINRHIMTVYAWPLRVYFLGTRDRWLGEPDDVVQGFFADRLAKPQFFADWQSSGLRLRHWLINAFCFYLKELKRARLRGSAPGASGEVFDERENAPIDDQDPMDAVDRAYAVSVVREALRRAGLDCEAQGLAPHWAVFVGHFCQGHGYAELCQRLGLDPARGVVMARTAKKKFQIALHDILSRDLHCTDVESEIRVLLGAAGAE